MSNFRTLSPFLLAILHLLYILGQWIGQQHFVSLSFYAFVDDNTLVDETKGAITALSGVTNSHKTTFFHPF